jgi:hypothetical protein
MTSPPEARLDVLHRCLILSAAVLLLAMWGGYGYLVRRSVEEWMTGMSKALDAYKQAEGAREELRFLEDNPDLHPERRAELEAEVNEARRVFSRDMMRGADREREIRRLRSVSWYGLAAVIVAIGLTSFGWFRWMRRRRRMAP